MPKASERFNAGSKIGKVIGKGIPRKNYLVFKCRDSDKVNHAFYLLFPPYHMGYGSGKSLCLCMEVALYRHWIPHLKEKVTNRILNDHMVPGNKHNKLKIWRLK